jgi:rSAM/selenodomain-associated transferase 1
MKALILMTRIPISGRTKTRLMKMLTGEECAEIHRCFLMDIFNTFKHLKDDIDIFITYTPDNLFHLIEYMVPEYASCFPQKGDNLGTKMMNAIAELLEKKYDKVVLMGSDVPDIQPEDIKNAFELLDENDIVLGPTFDGGYYLVGMKRMHREIFDDNFKWGNKSVFQGTVDIANKCGLKVGLVAKYRDIDTAEDLINFKERIDNGELNNKLSPENTVMYIKKLWSDIKDVERYIKR